MSENYSIDYVNCTLCNTCIEECPFDALEMVDDDEFGEKVIFNSACKACGICVKTCPEDVITKVERELPTVDKDAYSGVMIFAEQLDGVVHPVTFELMGKGKEMADKIDHELHVVLIGGEDVDSETDKLLERGADKVHLYQHEELDYFNVESYADIMEQCVKEVSPSIILMGATSVGRSLAPRVSTRFRTGLTADCTILDVREDTDLAQTRPAFGGNIMARILTSRHRPQMATVRYKIMDPAEIVDNPTGEVIEYDVSKEALESKARILKIEKKPPVDSIEDAEIIVCVGRGIREEGDLDMARELADLLGGQIGTTRPLIEKGWTTHKQQIGLSGRTVRPKLLIALGISGAVQWTAGMTNSENIFAINNDPEAKVFNVAHYGIVADLYDIVPDLIERIKNGDNPFEEQLA